MKTILLASTLALAAVLPAQAHSYKTSTYHGAVSGGCGVGGSGVYPAYDRLYGHRHLVGYYHWPCWQQPNIVVYEQPYTPPCHNPCGYPSYPWTYGNTGTSVIGY